MGARDQKNGLQSEIKLGFQTIIWGARFGDLDAVLEVIKCAGYDGVEFAQAPQHLGPLGRLLEQLGDLTLLGFAGGTLDQKVKYCESVPVPPDELLQYLYVQQWMPGQSDKAAKKGFPLALHPHLFTPIHRLPDAMNCLEQHPELNFILDTAHLMIAGDDPLDALRQVYSLDPQLGIPKIPAVHLKDWTAEFGRTSHRYAQGFVELGKGELGKTDPGSQESKLDLLLIELLKLQYNGWLVVEQDWTDRNPHICARESRDYLVESLGRARKRIEADAGEDQPVEIPSITLRDPCEISRETIEKSLEQRPAKRFFRYREEAGFIRSIIDAENAGYPNCFERVVEACAESIPCKLVMIWACSPANDLITLLSYKQASGKAIQFEKQYNTLNIAKTLSGKAIDGKVLARFRLMKDGVKTDEAGEFAVPELIDKLQLSYLIAIPILNPFNSNHPRYLLLLFPDEIDMDVDAACYDELEWLCKYVGYAANGSLEHHCTTAAAKANLLAGKSRSKDECLQVLLSLAKSYSDCEGLSIFLVDDEDEEKLRCAKTTGIQWKNPEEDFYTRDDGLTSAIWVSGNPRLVVDFKR